MIRLEHVCFTTRGDRTVLDGVSLRVNPTELVVVQGARATGKSVLLGVAAARLEPRSGAVWISDRKIGDLQRSSLPLVRRNIAYLPESPPFVEDDTALENVMLALAVRGWQVEASRAAARRALHALGLEDRGDRRIETLSAGDRRLVALARALAGLPPAVVVDEPATGMGVADRERVSGALAAARAEGSAVLVATSDETFAHALVGHGARRVRLEEGRLTGDRAEIALVGRAAATPKIPLEHRTGWRTE